jgi:murein DD-endopeptidase MepM/ murein hydrolase activator NlpD
MKKAYRRHIICHLAILHIPITHSATNAQSMQAVPPLQRLSQPNQECLLGKTCNSKDRKKFHTGVDYSAMPGTPVYAICDGEVHDDASKRSDIWDRFLIVKHNDCGGYTTLYGYYGHIDSLAGGKRTKIKKGQHIASVKEWSGD